MRLGRLRPPGLRARLVGALLVTAAATLAVAALTLLPPLERRLRSEEAESLRSTTLAFRSSFQDLDLSSQRPGQPQLAPIVHSLERKTGARVALFDRRLRPIVDTQPRDRTRPPRPAERLQERFANAKLALERHRAVTTTEGGSPGVAEVAVPVHISGHRYVIALRKRLGDVTVAVDVVKRAFTSAAAAGLAIALLLGVGLATTLLRRLHRLRDAAALLGERGLDAPVPEDRRHDEVGDLARAFGAMHSRLRQQEEARRRFVATASHELRTPLTSLQGVLELLDDDLASKQPDLDDAREQVARARAQSRRLNALAGDLLDLSRLDADVELRREPVDLGEVCRAVVSEFEVRLAERGLKLGIRTPEGPLWAVADPGGVAQIVRILVDNALRYTPPAEPVEVVVQLRDGEAEVAVTDRGPGVRPEERELIFDRFQRGSAQGDPGGFGLGLAIGRELAERMGGRLRLDGSEGGRVTRFALTLPATQAPAEL